MSWVLDGPWQRREVVWPSVRIGAGLLGIWVAYFGCSGTLEWTDQTVWMAVGSIALIVSLSGVAGWIRVGLRNLRHLERLMLGTARAQFAGAAGAIRADVAAESRSSALVTVPGTTLVHRADCLLVAGKAVAAAPSQAGLDQCGMCEP
ncbi:hypothetical protein GCM10009547_06970 [Sporichthya brevicatena]|uniref:Uncharacterized protein n=1 Tax=Sporichthya brevicatena TaxID=171442 RepID=A0ABP3RC83_9ACTN